MADTLLFRGGSSASIDLATIQSREIVIDTDTDQIVSGPTRKKTVMQDSSGDVDLGSIWLNASGSAEFATSVQVAGNGAAGTEVGIVLGAGSVNATRALGSNSNVFRGYYTGNSTPTSRISSDGSADLAGDVKIGGTLPASPNISLNADGSAEFAGGRIDIKSGGQIETYANNGNVLTLRRDGDIGNVGVEYGVSSNGVRAGLGLNNIFAVCDTAGNLNSAPVQLNGSTGSATFAGTIKAAGNSGGVDSITAGTTADPKYFVVRGNGTVLGNDDGAATTSNYKYRLNASGTAQFAGSVSIGGTAAANTIDEYEEGTWTPTVTANDGSAQTAVTVVSAQYVRVGKLVTLTFQLDVDYAVSNQTIRISSPFTIASETVCGGSFINTTSLASNTFNILVSGTTFRAQPPTGYTGSKSFRGSLSYFTT